MTELQGLIPAALSQMSVRQISNSVSHVWDTVKKNTHSMNNLLHSQTSMSPCMWFCVSQIYHGLRYSKSSISVHRPSVFFCRKDTYLVYRVKIWLLISFFCILALKPVCIHMRSLCHTFFYRMLLLTEPRQKMKATRHPSFLN